MKELIGIAVCTLKKINPSSTAQSQNNIKLLPSEYALIPVTAVLLQSPFRWHLFELFDSKYEEG